VTSSEPTRAHQRRRQVRRLRHAVTGVALAVLAVGAGGVSATVPEHQPTEDRAAAVLADADRARAGGGVGATEVAAEVSKRIRIASRSAGRAAEVPVKRAVLTRASRSGGQVAGSEDLRSADPRAVARAMLAEFGFGADQFSCLESLWEKESGWDPYAENPSSGAYGIPQSLPGPKMASAGADWAENPATQIRWGLGYIQDRYGSPCSAWGHSQANNWY
jgi:hypothetical protein